MALGWDYIVVGAGSAGAPLAARLSADPAVPVLLVDAGPDLRSSDTPPAFRTRDIDMTVERNPRFWWPDLQALRNPTQHPYRYLRGRGMGGSSTVNGLCAIRGVPADYDGWAEGGAVGWSFDEVLPYFVRLEDEHDFPEAPYHGRGGPVPVYREPVSGWGGVDHAFADAVSDAGFPWCGDHNAPRSTGLSPFAMNIRAGARVSTNDGYLEPARDRENLVIRGNTHVDTLTFGAGRTVTGVRLVDGERLEVNPGGEVIVACGAVHSPALLMRSGIGPADELAEHDIDVVADLPVGHGLQDHAMLMIEIPTVASARHSRDGRVTNCVLRYSSGIGGAGNNDMMLLPNNGGGSDHSWMIVQQEQVFSRGRLRLAGRDPLVDPMIDQRLLTDERDVARMRDAVERVDALLDHPSFAAILIERPRMPDPSTFPARVQDTVHICSSCRMGDSGDPASVVDPDCRVLGVPGLRVIDASVIPAAPRANLHLTVVMMAEVMADRLRG